MKTLHNLLQRYANIQPPDATLKKVFVSTVEDVVGVTIEVTQISIHKKTARINAPSVVKNEIRLNQKKILERVSSEFGDTNALTAIF
jgi:hypothetical protein